jgi:hypothetical protein
MAVPLLDTHAWIWWIEGDRRLPRRVRDTLDRLRRERPYLSAINLCEVAMLVERGRVGFSVSLSEWLDAAAHARSVRLGRSRLLSPWRRPPCQRPFIGAVVLRTGVGRATQLRPAPRGVRTHAPTDSAPRTGHAPV